MANDDNPRPALDTIHLGAAGVAIEREIAARRIAELEARIEELKAGVECYYDCVSKRSANDHLWQVARSLNGVADHWRGEARRLETERDAVINVAAALMQIAGSAGVDLTNFPDAAHGATPAPPGMARAIRLAAGLDATGEGEGGDTK